MKIGLLTLLIACSIISCVNKANDENLTNQREGITDQIISDSTPIIDQVALLKSEAFDMQLGVRTNLVKDYHGAIKKYSEVIRITPYDADAYHSRGSCKESLQDYRGAIVDYNMAIKLDSLNSDYYSSRGKVKVKQSKFREALGDFTTSIELDNSSYSSYHERAKLKHHNIKDYKGAVEDYSLAIENCNNLLELYPEENDGSRHILAAFAEISIKDYYIERGMVLLKIGNIDKACLDFSKAGELGDENAYKLIQKHCN